MATKTLKRKRIYYTIFYPQRSRFIVVKTAKKTTATDIFAEEFYNSITHRIPDISVEEYKIL
jgi:hypothetical protein